MNLEKRVRLIKFAKNKFKEEKILYWMSREIRSYDNWSLIFAMDLAKKYNAPLVIVYNLVPDFLGGNIRHLDFKIKALKKIKEKFDKKNIPFIILNQEKKDFPIVNFIKDNKISKIVTDFSPLKIQKEWNGKIINKFKGEFFEVDSHNIVPCFLASPKQEFGAYTIRPKIKRLLPDFLVEFPKIQKMPKENGDVKYSYKKTDLENILEKSNIDKSVSIINDFKSGEDEAKKVLKNFIVNKIKNYSKDRNNPVLDFQSNLSPYLHYGFISSQTVCLELLKSYKIPLSDLKKIKPVVKMGLNLKGLDENGDSFLEELIFRKELADNYCYYNENYDNEKGFPDWAKKSFLQTQNDKREYLYSKKEFEKAKTHDLLWNACQTEMVKTGKMHGYMRMYWAKKILEWTKNPKEAQEIAIYLNDKYELDGRDPNGYTGIAWSVGGVHDRAWPKRKIFGQIRYMSYSGIAKKIDIKKYIEKNLN